MRHFGESAHFWMDPVVMIPEKTTWGKKMRHELSVPPDSLDFGCIASSLSEIEKWL